MAKEKQKRLNRIVKLKRPLFQLFSELAYFQENEISTEEFINEILMEIGKYYGDKMQETAVKYRGGIVETYLDKTKVLNNPENNNRFFEEVNI